MPTTYADSFTPGWASRCILRPYDISAAGAAGTAYGIPLIPGATFNDPDDTRIEFLAQGAAAGAWPQNFNPGIHFPGLYLPTRAFMTSWFTVANLNLLMTARNSNGEQNPVDVYFTDGSQKDMNYGTEAAPAMGPVIRWGRVANLSLSGSARARGPVNASMSVLLAAGTHKGTSINAVAAAAIPSVSGAPLHFRGITFVSPAVTTTVPQLAPDAVEEFAIQLFTGANYGKTFDGNKYANIIDSGVMTGSFGITQRQSALIPLHRYSTVCITIECANFPTGGDKDGIQPIDITLFLVRQGIQETTVMGNAAISSQWSIFGADGVNAPCIFASAP